MEPLEWLTNLLARHGIPEPDRRPLYQYRITDEEFDSLRRVLRDASITGIEGGLRTDFFEPAFVIYGAEWWRRHYEGQWGWEGIFSSFTSNCQTLATGQRNVLVETGLHHWQRKVRTANFRRNFLGSIAIEGGLPLHQLASAGGWLQPTLNQVTKRYVELGEDKRYVELGEGLFKASYLVGQYSQYMPQTFQREEVYEILGDMITAVGILKRTYDLAAKDDPINWLNVNHPEWKSDFPLPLDDDTGNAVLADMVRTAISSKQDTKVAIFSGTRYLTGVSIGQPKLCFELQGQPSCRLSHLFTEDETEQIPQRLQLELFNSEGKTWRFADAYRVQWKGQPALKINNQHKRLHGEETLEGIRIRFRQLGDVFSELDIGVDGLDRDVPWTFIERGDRWQLAGQASQKLSANEAIVWVPDRLNPALTALGLASIGRFADGEFFKIDHDLSIEDDEDNYSIRVDQDEEIPVEYLLRGERIGYASVPTELFIGKPGLMVLNKITGQRNPVQSHQVRTRTIGFRGSWSTLADTLPGIHELQIVDGHTIMYRRRVGILPDNSSIKLLPGESPNQGTIRVNRLGGWGTACRSEEVNAHYAEKGNDLYIALSTPSSPPAEVKVEFWRDNPLYPITLTLPFPSSGAVLVNPLGAIDSTSADLLYGCPAWLQAPLLHKKARQVSHLTSPGTNR